MPFNSSFVVGLFDLTELEAMWKSAEEGKTSHFGESPLDAALAKVLQSLDSTSYVMGISHREDGSLVMRVEYSGDMEIAVPCPFLFCPHSSLLATHCSLLVYHWPRLHCIAHGLFGHEGPFRC